MRFDEDILKYLDEIDIKDEKLTEEEIQRIYSIEMNKISKARKMKKVQKRRYSYGFIAACIIALISFKFISPIINETNPPQIVNPIKQYNSFDDAEAVLGYKIEYPHILPKGYKQSSITVINDNILSINYKKDSESMTYRMSINKDIISDFDKYDVSTEITVGENKVILKGSSKYVNLAMWKKQQYSYAIYSSKGLMQNDMVKIINNIQKNNE